MTKEKISFGSMGTSIEIQLICQDQQQLIECEGHFAKIKQFYDLAMKTFSRFDCESELSKINSALGKSIACSVWMKTVALKTLEYNQKTEGFFDPRIIGTLESVGYDKDFSQIKKDHKATILTGEKFGNLEKDLIVSKNCAVFNHRMDFSGIVKGFITDQVAKYLRDCGYEHFLIDSGGDMYAAGHDLDQEFWLIGVEGIDEQKILLMLSNQAIATSGISRRKWEKAGKRFHHLINPKESDNFSFTTKSVTVVADSAEKADVWAKVLFLAEKEKSQKFIKVNNLANLCLNYNNQIRISSSLKKFVYE